MKKMIASFVGAFMLLFSCGNNNVSSSTNSVGSTSEQTTSTEAEVRIGTQIWAVKNLDVSVFRNGDTIPEAKTDKEWEKAEKKRKPAWCYYNNDPGNGGKYGKLYNWYAVSDLRGLAPQGWHVPAHAEWKVLTDYLGVAEVAGTKMKNTSGWNDHEGKTGNGTNESGFSGSPGGYRGLSGKFVNIGRNGIWWSSSECSMSSAWHRSLSSNFGDVGGYYLGFGKGCGLSVRCLRD